MKDDSESKVVHLLLKGEQSANDDPTADKYVIELGSRNLVSATIPVLEFNFINIELLSQRLRTLAVESKPIGLIITSPRVVEALHVAINLLKNDEQVEVVGKISADLLFIVGNKSSSDCERKLGLKCNNKSPECGNSANLTKYIEQFCDSFHKTTTGVISLLYPKGNLANTMIEDSLKHVDRLKIESIVVYETSARSDMSTSITRSIEDLNIKSDALTLNLVFFSPSGVKGYMNIDQNKLTSQLQQITSAKSMDILYSSIGKTTEKALTENKFPVLVVASEPSPSSLVDAIQQAFLNKA